MLAAEIERLIKGDAEFLSEESALQAVARPELSHGAFPPIGKMRFWEITTFRITPGARRRVGGRHQGLQGRHGAIGPERQLAHLRRRGRCAGRHVPVLLVGRVLRATSTRMMAEGEATWKGMTSEEGRPRQVHEGERPQRQHEPLPARPRPELRAGGDAAEGPGLLDAGPRTEEAPARSATARPPAGRADAVGASRLPGWGFSPAGGRRIVPRGGRGRRRRGP